LDDADIARSQNDVRSLDDGWQAPLGCDGFDTRRRQYLADESDGLPITTRSFDQSD